MAEVLSYDSIAEEARAAGLDVFGAFHPAPEDDVPSPAGTLLLLGPHEPGFWPRVRAAPEFTDGQPDPLDRWSRRVVGRLACALGGKALFPFGGPPWHPFYRWALRSGRSWSSPVQLLVHDRAGLMVSYRGAIALRPRLDLPAPPSAPPCTACPRIWLRNSLVRSCCGLEKNSSGSFCSTIWPWSMKITRFGTWRAKPISWVTHSMVMPSSARLTMVEHLLDHLGIERRGRLVEQHDLRGFMHSERAIATRCCWPPESWPGYLCACSGIFTRSEVHRDLLGLALGHLAHPDRRQRAVLQDRQMREQVEVLEHHADLAADLVDALEVVGQLDAVDDDLALLVLLEPVDAADQRRLARARRPADHDALAARPRGRCRAARGTRRTTCSWMPGIEIFSACGMMIRRCAFQ
jgi:hypothetical protein